MLEQSLWTYLFLWLLKFYFFLGSAAMGFVWCQYGVMYLCQGCASMKTQTTSLIQVCTEWAPLAELVEATGTEFPAFYNDGLLHWDQWIWFEKLHCSSWKGTSFNLSVRTYQRSRLLIISEPVDLITKESSLPGMPTQRQEWQGGILWRWGSTGLWTVVITECFIGDCFIYLQGGQLTLESEQSHSSLLSGSLVSFPHSSLW